MSNKRRYIAGAAGVAAGVISFQVVKREAKKNAVTGDEKKKILVVGAGYAGRTFCEAIDSSKYSVTIVDKNIDVQYPSSLVVNLLGLKKVIFQPQPNYVDSIANNEIVNQYTYLDNRIDEIQDEVLDIRTKHKQVLLRSNTILNYDYLVVATGSIPDTYHVKMNYNCMNNMWYYFKNKNDLSALMLAFNVVGLDDIVIMGGGITGVELASELAKRIAAEEKKLLTAAATTEPVVVKPKRHITILEAGDRLLPKLKESTSSMIAKHLIEQQHVKIVTSAQIQEITDGVIKLTRNGQPEEIKAVIAVWTCGVKSDDLLTNILGTNTVHDQLQLMLPVTATSNDANNKTADGTTTTTEVITLEQPSDSIFAIGDCNTLLPKSAQNSKQQGRHLAGYFNSNFSQDFKPFQFTSQGSMIRLSDRVFMDSPVYTGMLPLWVHRGIIWLDL